MAWTRHQTMLINENRLSLADPRAREYLAQQMEQYFFGDGADAVQGYVPQEPKISIKRRGRLKPDFQTALKFPIAPHIRQNRTDKSYKPMILC